MTRYISYLLISFISVSLYACASGDSPFIGSSSDDSVSTPSATPPSPSSVNNGNISLTSNNTTTEFTSADPVRLVLSDDNTTLIVSSSADFGNNPDGVEQLFTLSGSTFTQITSFTAANPGFEAAANQDRVISRDGTTITWISSTNAGGLNAGGDSAVFSINSDGTNLRILATTNGAQIIDATPAIRSDGTLVYFASNGDHTGGNATNLSQIFSVTTDGANTFTQITNHAFAGLSVKQLDISSDDSGLVFIGSGDWLNDGSNADGSDELYTMTSTGTGLAQHTDETDPGAVIFKVVFSDDGNVMAYSTKRTAAGSTGIYTYTISSTTRITITSSWSVPLNLTTDFIHFDMSGDALQVLYVTATGKTVAADYQIILVSSNVAGTGAAGIVQTDDGALAITNFMAFPDANTDASRTYIYSDIDFGKTSGSQVAEQIYTVIQ